MSKTITQEQLISHTISTAAVEEITQKIAARIKQNGDKSYTTVTQQLEFLDQLKQFDFGRFLLQNQGINGYWTHYMLTHPWSSQHTEKPLTSLENFILNRLPIMLATQERFEIFLRENQKQVKNAARLACIPCGMMGELLYLDYDNITNIELIGIDYDPDTLKDAKSLAEKQGLIHLTKLMQGNAWHLNLENAFDLITSNGLNIYEPDIAKVTELYRQFYKALKPNGKLVTSFLTYPPILTDKCEWDMSKVNQEDLLLQRIVLVDIIEVKFQSFSSTEQTKQQLESLGYCNIEFIYDKARIFPTVVATKK